MQQKMQSRVYNKIRRLMLSLLSENELTYIDLGRKVWEHMYKELKGGIVWEFTIVKQDLEQEGLICTKFINGLHLISLVSNS